MCSFFVVQMGNRFEHYDDSEQIQVVKGTVRKKMEKTDFDLETHK